MIIKEKSKNGLKLAVFYIFVLSFLFQSIVYAGFGAHTPVMLPTGEYRAIKNIRIGDTVLSYDERNGYVTQEVIDIKLRQAHDGVCVVFDNTYIITAHNQKLYIAGRNRWQMAGYLRPGDLILGQSGETIVVKCVLKISRPVKLYDLTVKEYHNFLVSQYGIIAHNFVPAVALGISVVCGSGAIELASVTLGVGACTLGLGSLVSWVNNKREELEFLKTEPMSISNVQAEAKRENKYRCPFHEQCDRVHPHGLYEEVKHNHDDSQDGHRLDESTCPVNGQWSLDCSHKASDSATPRYRVGFNGSELAVFSYTGKFVRNGILVNIWHGHVRPWDQLDSNMRSVIYKYSWSLYRDTVYNYDRSANIHANSVT